MKNKIFLCISFVLVMLFTSSCTDYTFGFQDNEKFKIGNTVTIGYYQGPIKWRVLEVKDNKALLISEHILFNSYFDENNSGIWKKSTLRRFLNKDFFEVSFSEEEKKSILSRIHVTHGYPTSDKLFLLSEEEAKKYFKDNKDRVAHDLNGNSYWWWLRSRGIYDRGVVDNNGCKSCIYGHYTTNVGPDGTIDTLGYYAGDDGTLAYGNGGGVRVALLWNLDS